MYLTYEDRMALLDRAEEDTQGEGRLDYYGQLVELATLFPDQLETLKTERKADVEAQRQHGSRFQQNYLRIVQ